MPEVSEFMLWNVSLHEMNQNMLCQPGSAWNRYGNFSNQWIRDEQGRV